MLTKKFWLLAIPAAFVALNGCGGGRITDPVPPATPTATPPVASDNIGRFTNIAPTNGQNNLENTNFVPSVNSFVEGEPINSFFLFEGKSDANRSQTSERQFVISTTQGDEFGVDNGPSGPEFVAGRSYSFGDQISAGDSRAYASYVQTAGVNGTGRVRFWRAVSGTLIVSEVSRATANSRSSAKFRIVNARFEPNTMTASMFAPDNPFLGQGAFTFDLNGTATAQLIAGPRP